VSTTPSVNQASPPFSTRLASRLAPGLPTLGLVAVKAAVSAWVVHTGFTHVSDDDYARVTLAQAFAHAPRLDPSGTSWLPFPFWLNGAAMALAGRSLAVARGVAWASSLVGVLLVHRMLVRLRVAPWVAWCGVALAMSAPWSAWLGVATVPEALTASLIVCGALALAPGGARVRGGVALLAASLSRYEAWPVALVFAVTCAVLAWRPGPSSTPRARWTDTLAAALALAGPVLWVGWNAHAHGDALHFLGRVAAYRVKMAGTASPASWTLYPAAFVRAAPLCLLLATVALPAFFADRELRRRWIGPLGAALALVAFLVEGDLHNGAPTHHPERALIAVFWIATIFGVDGARSLTLRFIRGRSGREACLVAVVTAVSVAWGIVWPSRIAEHPARSESEDRTPQLARGEALRREAPEHITVQPCAYEHFAMIAAFEAPERVTVEAPAMTAVTAGCPGVGGR